MNEHTDFHEVWWIYSPNIAHEWAGLRIGHFRKTANGDTLLVTIANEIDPTRMGMRVWETIQRTELWYKVEQIPIQTWIESAETWQMRALRAESMVSELQRKIAER